jgi:GNAT superfamily N-acetyltransferase
MSAIEIVRAQPHDAATLKFIAVAAKSYWGYPEHLIAAWAASPIISPMDIAHSPVYVAYNVQQAIGWYRLLTDRSPAILEDLWVIPSWIGRGIGRALFEHAIAQCHAHGVTQMELDADPNAVGFYLRMGGRVIGESISEWQRPIPQIRFDLAPLR